MHRRLDIGVFLSLDNDDEMDIIYFAGIKYHQTHESFPSKSQNVSIEKDHASPLQKRASIVFASDSKSKKVAAMSEREIGKGELRFCVVSCQLPFS